MKKTNPRNPTGGVAAILAVLVLAGTSVFAADAPAPASAPAFKPEELEQMLAPIALYPDTLLSQMLMASTYPLEVVQGDRWIKQNKDLKGDALTKALEAQSWDASVKSLVNFPTVLAMMSDNLDVTVKIGDAFIGQQQQVLETIQKLRVKAQETGNLKTTPEQTVAVEPQGTTQVIVIQAANPQVVYIPTYSPTVYYAVWPYPAYPPVVYYPPGYVVHTGFAFAAGVAVGAAWGYAWGHCDWGHGNIDIDINRNTNINANINRSKYEADIRSRNTTIRNGTGSFQHDPAHRQGVAYQNQSVASQFGRASSANATQAREAFRGRTDTGAGGLLGGGASNARPSVNSGAASSLRSSPTPAARTSAFSGLNSGGTAARSQSLRGSSSRSSSRSAASSRSFGGGGGRLGGRR
jgi:hypothetical protein